jgi:arginine/serine-rich splicing factor 1/9
MYGRGEGRREGTVIYVGNLPLDTRERELDDLFYKYGRIVDIDIKRPARPPAFGGFLLCLFL